MTNGSLYIGVDDDKRVIVEAERICAEHLEALSKDWPTRTQYKRYIASQLRLENIVPLKEKVIVEESEQAPEKDPKEPEKNNDSEQPEEIDDEMLGQGKVDDLDDEDANDDYDSEEDDENNDDEESLDKNPEEEHDDLDEEDNVDKVNSTSSSKQSKGIIVFFINMLI